MPTGQSRALRMEAQIAAENQKKKTVARAPNFASDARAKRRNHDLLQKYTAMTPRKPSVPKEPVTPSLHTLERARQRASMTNVKGETHRLDDPYTAGPKYQPLEPIMYKGRARHEQPFFPAYTKQRAL